jgi:transcriptional regulator with XRE-family HTH domain
MLLHMPRRQRPTTEFGPRLRQLRMERGWTQDDLASRIKSTQRAIHYYETAGKYPPAPVVADLAAVLGVSMEALMGRNDIPEPTHRIAGLNLLDDADDRRLWKKFRLLRELSERDQAAIIRMLNTMADAKHLNRSA